MCPSVPLPRLPRPARAWLFAGVFALILLAAWRGRPLAAQDAPHQTVPPAGSAEGIPRLYLPALARPGAPTTASCPTVSSNVYAQIPIAGSPRRAARPPAEDPDLNLAVRDYVAADAAPTLVAINGETDGDPPQLASLFRPRHIPALTAAYRVHDWDWSCAAAPPGQGCRGAPLAHPEVSLLGMAAAPGETLYPPARRAQILGGGYLAQVLFAGETQLTLTYARDDSPAYGYVIHLENLCVDAALLELYRSLDTAGRWQLPGLRGDSPLGTAQEQPLLVAVRDSGSFMDPRSRKDWWQGE
jgi:hypothetical protein